jgi:hypothetical protein
MTPQRRCLAVAGITLAVIRAGGPWGWVFPRRFRIGLNSDGCAVDTARFGSEE